MIDLLIPVLGRPDSAATLAESIRSATVLPHSIIFVCSRGDDAQIDACKRTEARILLVDGGDHEYARKINHAAAYDWGGTPAEFWFLGADDLRFHAGWDRAAVAVHDDTGKRVIGTQDLGNPLVKSGRHATHSVVHRSYLEQGTIDEPGKLLHEGYHHNWVDNEFVGTAKHRGEWTFAHDSVVEHLHPIWRKRPDDVIYQRGQEHYRTDMRLHQQRRRLWR